MISRRFSSRITSGLALPLACALVAGCSAAPSTLTPSQSGSAALTGAPMSERVANSPLTLLEQGKLDLKRGANTCPASEPVNQTEHGDSTSGTLFVSQFGGKTPDVDEFDASGTNKKTLGILNYDGFHNPAGISVDSAGNLWVANYNGNNVLEFPQGATTPSTILSYFVLYPLKVSVDPQGDVYVVNDRGGPIMIYPPGQYIPSQLGGFVYPTDVAFDASHFYVVDDAWGGAPPLGAVFKFAYGSQKGTNLNLSGLDYPIGIALDGAGNMYVTNLGNNTVNVYAPGATTPNRVISKGICAPLYDVVTSSNILFVANNGGKKHGNVTGYKPTGTKQFVTLNKPMANTHGVAVNPNWQP
jgi:sugar lactone lactonase YvrE